MYCAMLCEQDATTPISVNYESRDFMPALEYDTDSLYMLGKIQIGHTFNIDLATLPPPPPVIRHLNKQVRESAFVYLSLSSILGCFCSKKDGLKPLSKERAILASETAFTLNEIEALYDLCKKLSSSIIKDGLFHKEEFLLALFSSSTKHNLFADRLFDLFDIKHNGVIEFGEFVRSLSIFHPSAPEADKIACKRCTIMRLYDLRNTGYIEQEEVMVLELLRESDLTLPDDAVEAILDKAVTITTILEADLKGDGRIDPEERRDFVARNPSIIKNMTLPFLRGITQAFPNFVLTTDVNDSELHSYGITR